VGALKYQCTISHWSSSANQAASDRLSATREDGDESDLKRRNDTDSLRGRHGHGRRKKEVGIYRHLSHPDPVTLSWRSGRHIPQHHLSIATLPSLRSLVALYIPLCNYTGPIARKSPRTYPSLLIRVLDSCHLSFAALLSSSSRDATQIRRHPKSAQYKHISFGIINKMSSNIVYIDDLVNHSRSFFEDQGV
jgi:hypothetical protein